MHRSELGEALIREGDRVCLKQPFRPNLSSPEEYSCGVIVGLIQASPTAGKTEVTGIVLYLYDPQTFVEYLDESGKKILFYFKRTEVEPYSSN